MSRGAGNGPGAPQSYSRELATPMPTPTPLIGPCGLLSAFETLRGLGLALADAWASRPGKQKPMRTSAAGRARGQGKRTGRDARSAPGQGGARRLFLDTCN